MLGDKVITESLLDRVRIMKKESAVIAGYRFRKIDQLRFRLSAIGVVTAYQGMGIATWLIQHLIGVAETKGAREVWLPKFASSIPIRLGFEQMANGDWRYQVTME